MLQKLIYQEANLLTYPFQAPSKSDDLAPNHDNTYWYFLKEVMTKCFGIVGVLVPCMKINYVANTFVWKLENIFKNL